MSLLNLIGTGVLAFGGAGQDATHEYRIPASEVQVAVDERRETNLPYLYAEIDARDSIEDEADRQKLRKKSLDMMHFWNNQGFQNYMVTRASEIGLEAVTGVRTDRFSEKVYSQEFQKAEMIAQKYLTIGWTVFMLAGLTMIALDQRMHKILGGWRNEPTY